MRSLVLLTLAACSDAPSKLDAVAASSGSGPAFVLLDRGLEPRTELRYSLTPSKGDYRIETRITTHRLTETGFGPATALPPIRDGFTITPDQQGLVLRAVEAETVGAATEEAGAYIREWRDTVGGRAIAADFDARGQLGEVRVQGEPDHRGRAPARDQVTQRLLTTIVPVPAEPVGLGATWRVETHLRQGPVNVVQIATYALVARLNGRWSIAMKIQRRGDHQPMQIDGADPVELVDLFRELDGTVHVDPQRPLPVDGTLELGARLHSRTHDRTLGDREIVADDTGTVEFMFDPR